ncbi:MAG: dTDP-4-dehydrorhamnose reductase [Clostridiales bacterium]|nr:dTDP-4-dehydrorhamnose reductase [Clostridiales bacterium]
MKILVTGSKGQLGSDLSAEIKKRGHVCIPADIDDFDITDEKAVSDFILSASPDAVIHCAAYTAVDKAESETELCRLINATGTKNVASASQKCGSKLLVVSSDYVYGDNGGAPHLPTDETSPVNFYGVTKLEAENEAEKLCEKLFIVRTSWVFGKNGNNFVKTMLSLSETKECVCVVNDQTGSPTYTKDLSPLLCDIAESDKYGVYNASNEGYCTWAEFASAVMTAAGRDTKVVPIPSSEYKCAAKRPVNSRLSKECLDKAGFKRLPDWHDALERYIKELL